MVISKTGLHFESVPIFLIFYPQNIVISKKIDLSFKSVSDFCKRSARVGPSAMPPPALNNYLQCKNNAKMATIGI